MIHDKIKNYKTYPYGKSWEVVFSFLDTLNVSSEEKKYDLGDGIFAMVMSYATREESTAVLESHRKYVDIQVTISGAEGIGWFPSEELKVLEEYNLKNDVTFYKHTKPSTLKIENHSGFFTVLWPSDGHMPQLKVGEIKEVKKVVIKVPVELLKI